LSQDDDGFFLEVLVQPRASRTKILGEHDGRLKIQLASPPVDGEANEALVKMLSKRLGLPRSAVILCSGQTGRRKRLRLTGASLETLLRLLAP